MRLFPSCLGKKEIQNIDKEKPSKGRDGNAVF
jgi:hypothetical protein